MLLRRARTVQTVQKMRGFHSAVLGDAVDTPVVFQRQVLGLVQPMLKTVEVPQLQYFQSGRCPWFAVHRQGVDVPAIMQRRSLAVGGVTDTVHRLIW